MNIRPLHDRVIVKRLDNETKSAGGIVLPGSAQEKPQMGEIVAAGSGRVLDNGESRAMSVKKGDKVLFGKFSGTEIKVDGQQLLVMKEDDLFAVIEG
ncbi:MAG: co-chaperone GroES [Gammaproteobacteria bacterium]|nr:co-chaperone GroES [Gammaproteobacteria bacterium]